MEENKHNARKEIKLQDINGLLVSTRFSIKNFQQAISFETTSDDVFIAGYPKSGTTWTQYIVWDIVNRGVPLPNVNDMWCKEVPHLELTGTEGLENLKSPRLLKVNLPYTLTPHHPSAKYIYVLRNPWDSCVSAFNHFRQVDETVSNWEFKDYFECFIRGQVPFGDYFDHLLSWYSRWNDPNVLFLTYEGMKRETRNVILRIARFLGEGYHEALLTNTDMMENILKQIQFDHMKNNCTLMVSELSYSHGSKSGKKINFFSSGSVGQWRNYFSEDQFRRLKEKFLEKLGGTEMLSLWKHLEFMS